LNPMGDNALRGERAGAGRQIVEATKTEKNPVEWRGSDQSLDAVA
jgi:hypothetical protein